MSAIIEVLAAVAVVFFALTQLSAGFAALSQAGAALRDHHDQRYLLHICGATLAAIANLDEAKKRLLALGAADGIADKAAAYQARLSARLAEVGHSADTCRRLRYGGYRLGIYLQNPAEPSHWPNYHFTLTPAEADDRHAGDPSHGGRSDG